MTKIKKAMLTIGITLTDEQIERFNHFYNLTVEKNAKVNLTAITDYEEFILKHFMDSLSIVLLKNESKEVTNLLESSHSKVLDLGTGGGFPGIPLSLVYEKPQFTLMDSLQKRIHFLNEAVAKLSVANVFPIHGRAEEFARKADYREQFDLCTCRAVANLSTLCEYALPFVKVGGYFVSYKSGQSGEEIEQAKHAIQLLGGKIITTYHFSLPMDFSILEDDTQPDIQPDKKIEPDQSKTDQSKTNQNKTDNNQQTDKYMSRCFIVIQKIKHTPKKYPRKPGTPSKEPLG